MKRAPQTGSYFRIVCPQELAPRIQKISSLNSVNPIQNSSRPYAAHFRTGVAQPEYRLEEGCTLPKLSESTPAPNENGGKRFEVYYGSQIYVTFGGAVFDVHLAQAARSAQTSQRPLDTCTSTSPLRA